MEDLIPRSAYDQDMKQRYKLVPIMALLIAASSGLLFGISMMVALGLSSREDVFARVGEFALAGLMFGSLMGLFVLISLPIGFHYLSAGVKRLYMRPSPHEGVRYRLVCALVMPDKQSVIGNLYLGERDLEFLPFGGHTFITVKRRLSDELTIAVVRPKLNLFQGITFGFGASLIEITTDIDVISIWVPQANPSIGQIRDSLEVAVRKMH